MYKILVSKQTQAEDDSFLDTLYFDNGNVKELLDGNQSIILGRKGSGKTALAKHIEKRSKDYGLLYSKRFSFNISNDQLNESISHEHLLVYTVMLSLRSMVDSHCLDESIEKLYQEFLIKNGWVTSIPSYFAFIEKTIDLSSNAGVKGGMKISIPILSGSIDGNSNVSESIHYEKVDITKSFDNLLQLIILGKPSGKVIFFLDDVTDWLDSALDHSKIKGYIQSFYLFFDSLNKLNAGLRDAGLHLRFVSCLRDDIFDEMEGSNVNKLQNSSLQISRNEIDVIGFILKRISDYKYDESDLRSAIKTLFPDNLFTEYLKAFETKQYSTKFYAYLVAISFNRPRDYLKFLYTLSSRIPSDGIITTEHIDAAESEYIDYFYKELRDEMFVSRRILGISDSSGDEFTKKLIEMSKINGFGQQELRTHLLKYVEQNTSSSKNKVDAFLKYLYRYGLIGYKKLNSDYISYRYLDGEKILLQDSAIKYYLHRGIWWYARKYRN